MGSDGISLRTVLALGRYAQENSADVLKLGEGITRSIAQSGIAEVIKEVELDPRDVHVAGTPDKEEIPETMMVAPLIASNRIHESNVIEFHGSIFLYSTLYSKLESIFCGQRL